MESKPDIVINGRVYKMWQQFVHKKDEWISGVLREMYADRIGHIDTEIVDVKLEPNGDDSACFIVVGKEFTCAGDVHHLGIGSPDWLDDKTFLCLRGFGGHIWGIKRRGA